MNGICIEWMCMYEKWGREGGNDKKARKKRGRKFSRTIDALLLLAQRAGARQDGREGYRDVPPSYGRPNSRRGTRPRRHVAREGKGGAGMTRLRVAAASAPSRCTDVTRRRGDARRQAISVAGEGRASPAKQSSVPTPPPSSSPARPQADARHQRRASVAQTALPATREFATKAILRAEGRG